MAHNITDFDDSERLLEQVNAARRNGTALRIRGGYSKSFLGRHVQAEELDTRNHTGVVHYDPTELVITARAGTRLHDLNALLATVSQHFPPEAPDFDGHATIGGMVAAGLAGPRRPWSGSVRDFVLGSRFISAQGKHMRFGGEVMKNVAGYDFSRLLAGSHGCLGVITEVSLKVLPLPRASCSLQLQASAEESLENLRQWRRDDLPISGAFHWNDSLYIRLEGGHATVDAARKRIGGTDISANVWADLREHRLPFFNESPALWRLSVPWQTPLAQLPGQTLMDWGGAQRWLKTDAAPQQIREIAASLNGHAICYSSNSNADPFDVLAPGLMGIHQRLKQQVDPDGLFNPGRMYAEL